MTEEVALRYPNVEVEHILVDAAAMELIRNPGRFDVIVTENLFGDILSDEASVLAGSLGMLPSASHAEKGPSLYEPIHGSAPDIGKNKANPIAMMRSVAMMLGQSFGLTREGDAIEEAVSAVLKSGKCTADIGGLKRQLHLQRQLFKKWKSSVSRERKIMGKRLLDKLWERHVVATNENGLDLLYIDLHLVHEVTSPQAFEGLRLTNRTVRRPDLTFATMDHNIPTKDVWNITDRIAKQQLDTLRQNCKQFQVPLADIGDEEQGIVHVIGPELGLTQPGKTIVCGDSHTATRCFWRTSVWYWYE